MKKWFEKLRERVMGLLILLLPLLITFVIVILINCMSYMIATSDLPDWFKFWLLK